MRTLVCYLTRSVYSLSAAMIDESAENGSLSPEVAGIRRVDGVKLLGQKIGNWLSGNQAQELLNADLAEHTTRQKRWRYYSRYVRQVV